LKLSFKEEMQNHDSQDANKVGAENGSSGKRGEAARGVDTGLSGPALEAGTEMKNQDPGDYPPQAGGNPESPLPERDYESKGDTGEFDRESTATGSAGFQSVEKRLEKVGFLDLIYGTLAQPRDTFRYLADARPVFQSVIFVLLVTLFNYSVGFREMNTFDAGLSLGVDVSALLGPFFVLGLVITLMAWFFTTAVVNLISQMFGGVGNGPGLLAAFGFAMLPILITSIFDFGITFLGLGAFIGGLVSLAGFIWTAVLHVLAVREVEQLSLGRAVAAYFIFPLSIIAILILLIVITIAVMGPLFNQLPIPLR
jgi:hypothetical protein